MLSIVLMMKIIAITNLYRKNISCDQPKHAYTNYVEFVGYNFLQAVFLLKAGMFCIYGN